MLPPVNWADPQYRDHLIRHLSPLRDIYPGVKNILHQLEAGTATHEEIKEIEKMLNNRAQRFGGKFQLHCESH